MFMLVFSIRSRSTAIEKQALLTSFVFFFKGVMGYAKTKLGINILEKKLISM